MENMEIYEKARSVPENAQKTIKGGRLNGMTDINPMWRIKKLTELFGACGIGWVAPIKCTWLDSLANGEVVASVEIELLVKVDGEWSKPIPGIGGSKAVAKESGGLYTDDECYKKAYTDAISVACKALGFGADVYWDKDKTKYDTRQQEPSKPRPKPLTVTTITAAGIDNAQETIDWFEEKMGKPVATFSDEELKTAWGFIDKRRQK